MKTRFKKYYQLALEHKNDPLFKNSYYLIGNTFITAAVGFIFWIIAARLYFPEEIGISSAVISAMSLISVFSLLGFDISLIRFLDDQKDKESFINSLFTLTSVFTILLAVIFIMFLGILAPDLTILRENWVFTLIFIISTVFFSIFTLQLSVFIGFRTVRYSFFQSFLNLFKILLLPFLIMLGSLGIFISFSIFYLIAVIVGIIFIKKFISSYKFIPSIKLGLIKKMVNYSFNNYIANIFYSTPHFLLPIIVLSVLGPLNNAYFYIAWTFSSILLTIPFAVSRSFLAEGSSYEGEFEENIFKSLKFTFLLLFLAFLLIVVLGKSILSLFGAEYALNAFNILILLSLSSFPFTVIQIFASLKRLENDIKPVIYVNLCVAVITITLSYLMMGNFGILGVGYAWLAANILVATYAAIKLKSA